MNRNAIAIIAAQGVIIIALFWALVYFGQDEYESYAQKEVEEEIGSAAPRVASENGAAVVSVSSEAQQQSAIQTETLKPGNFRASLSSFGTVIDIQPLLELRTRYLAALAEAEVVRATLATSRQEYQRLQVLNQDDHNVSDRAVAEAEATLKENTARLNATQTAAASLRDSMRQQWGTPLADWAAGDSSAMAQLLHAQEVLLRITLPFDAPSPAPGSAILVAPSGARGTSIKANFISVAPQTDGALAGKTYYYRAPAASLRSGMRVTATLAGPEQAGSGVIIPSTAVIWYANQAWVYQQTDATHFVRRAVSTEQEVEDGWFNNRGLKAGDTVIVRGAQLLLSEEFKYQIKNENED